MQIYYQPVGFQSPKDYLDTTKQSVAKSDDFLRGWCNMGDTQNIRQYTAIRPNERQLLYLKLGYYNFIHYGMNTFTGKEWGNGNTPPAKFNPTTIDTDQWAKTLKESGSKAIVFTAKHHDGFCMWPSEATDYTIAQSPYLQGKGDVVKQLSESCKKFGLKFGIYLSPWDMHEPTYGTDAYNDFYVKQLTELLSNYGEIFMIWLDGARGKDVDVGDWNYDFERYYKVINELQPNCIIANCGPDVRWIGNEQGLTRESEWSVIADGLKPGAPDLGSRKVLEKTDKYLFSPAEADVSIRKGWFYHRFQRPKKVNDLVALYYKVVGGNASLLLNVPPSKDGVITEHDAAVLRAFGKRIADDFSQPIRIKSISAGTDTKLEKNPDMLGILNSEAESYRLKEFEYLLEFDISKSVVSRIVIKEDIAFSQRIEDYDLYAKTGNGIYKLISSGTVIGNKKIICLKSPIETNELRFVIRSSRGRPRLLFFGLYK